MLTKVKALAVITLTSFMVGCASDSSESILPQEGPTMKEVYDHHFTGTPIPKRGDENNKRATNENTVMIRRPLTADHDLSGYTREAHTEINQLFPRLANPTLVIYIYPHLAGSERHPVPGYSSAFTLYEKVEYALPGEQEGGY